MLLNSKASNTHNSRDKKRKAGKENDAIKRKLKVYREERSRADILRVTSIPSIPRIPT